MYQVLVYISKKQNNTYYLHTLEIILVLLAYGYTHTCSMYTWIFMYIRVPYTDVVNTAAGIANTQVDPRWRPYIGEISWEDIQKQLSVNSKKLGDRKRKAKAQETAAEQGVLALTPAAVADSQSTLPGVEAGETRPASRGFLSPDAIAEELMTADANSVIAAYTGGLEQSS
jgi:hypothetical protein